MGLFDHIKTAGLRPGFPAESSNQAASPSETLLAAETQSVESNESATDFAVPLAETESPASSDPATQTAFPPKSDKSGQKFSVGIDLGTTHSVLSYVELNLQEDDAYSQAVMPIPQLIAPGLLENKLQLPSFVYLAHEAELAAGASSLPWTEKPDLLVGEIARHLGAKSPMRLVASAKSWLCHSGYDCKAATLPVDAPEEVQRISPFEASRAFLAHIMSAWAESFPQSPLSEQELTITVPASFDPAARDLTFEAAQSLGLSKTVLLEEPQAALYSWIEQSGGDWRKQVKVGDILLVVDVGGGTTDLSLIAVTEQAGNLELTRIAVGDHILLGGDNMDLALAYTLKAKLEAEGKSLESWQVQGLAQGCRDAKEKLFNQAELSSMPLVVPSRGSSLIGGTLRTELTREELNRVLVEGFLPQSQVGDKPMSRPRSGLRSVGLPYAQDAGITRHLAAFLSKQLSAAAELKSLNLPAHASFLHPAAVLFNGGVLKAEVMATRLMQILNSWLEAEQAPSARLLAGADLDLAVARGAAYYGYVRQGKGVRIKGGTAAAYYVGIESAMPAIPGLPAEIQALCIAPFGMEEGTEENLPDEEFGLVVGEPVRFRFFASNTRREDRVGTRLSHWSSDELEELDEIEVSLPVEDRKSGEIVSVHLGSAINELGTLELQAVSGQSGARWKIQFDVRAGEEN